MYAPTIYYFVALILYPMWLHLKPLQEHIPDLQDDHANILTWLCILESWEGKQKKKKKKEREKSMHLLFGLLGTKQMGKHINFIRICANRAFSYTVLGS